MDRNQESVTIVDSVLAVFESFCNLGSYPTGSAVCGSSNSTQLHKFLPLFENEMTRFNMWAGNLAAHQNGLASLDH